MNVSTPKVSLVAHTPDPIGVCALAARTCYSALPLDELLEKVKTDQSDFLRGVIRSGHTSVLEHASFTFYVSDVSRALLAQITRHRIASFSVQSQRYVSMSKGFDCVVPPRIAALGEEAGARYQAQMAQMADWYREWQDAFGDDPGANEDARFVLPNACVTRLTMTMNARELLHFFSLRCCNRAQWEIRTLAEMMFRLVLPVAPAIFENAGPACVRGACPEGSRSCGQAQEVRDHYRALREEANQPT
ncbi:MAG: FAD-dependent thymidylate synthase [Clostridia bacterium]|nr:FAD-dependent thymidylate synthase [Clostridia bacterium]